MNTRKSEKKVSSKASTTESDDIKEKVYDYGEITELGKAYNKRSYNLVSEIYSD